MAKKHNDIGFHSKSTILGIIVLIGALFYLSTFDSADAILTIIPKDYILATTETPIDQALVVAGQEANVAQSLVLINPTTGEQILIPTFLLGEPIDIVIDSNGDLIVIDDGEEDIAKIKLSNPLTEEFWAVAEGDVGIEKPISIAVDSNGDFIVIGTDNNLIKIDKITGEQTLLSADGLLEYPTDVSISQSDDYVVTIKGGSLIIVDSSSSVQTTLSENVETFVGPNAPTTNAVISGLTNFFKSIEDSFTDPVAPTAGSFVKRVIASTDDAEQDDDSPRFSS